MAATNLSLQKNRELELVRSLEQTDMLQSGMLCEDMGFIPVGWDAPLEWKGPVLVT